MVTYQITFNEKTTFGKNLIALFLQNKKLVKLKEEQKELQTKKQKKDPTLLTEEEFDAKIEEARAQYERGEYYSMLPGENIYDFLKRVNNEL